MSREGAHLRNYERGVTATVTSIIAQLFYAVAMTISALIVQVPP